MQTSNVWGCSAREKLAIARGALERFQEEHPKIIGKVLKDTEDPQSECSDEVEKLRSQLCEAKKPPEELESLRQQLAEAKAEATKPSKELEDMRKQLARAKAFVKALEPSVACKEVRFIDWKLRTCLERSDTEKCLVCTAKQWVESA
jgi:uncharacterized protein YhaN